MQSLLRSARLNSVKAQFGLGAAKAHALPDGSAELDSLRAQGSAGCLNESSSIPTSLPRLGSRRMWRLLIVMGLDMLGLMLTLQMVLALDYPTLGGGPLHKIAFVLQFSAAACLSFWLSGLYRQSWRFIRIGDCIHLVRSVVIGLTVAWLIGVMTMPMRLPEMPLLVTVPVMHASLLIVVMGAMRITRKQLREVRRGRVTAPSRLNRAQAAKRAIVLGPPDWALSVIDLVRDDRSGEFEIVGVLLSEDADMIGRLSGVPVLGGGQMLASAVVALEERGKAPNCLILCDRGMGAVPGARTEIAQRAKKLDLEVCWAANPSGQLLRAAYEGGGRKLSTSQLLGRPEFSMVGEVVDECVRGKRVLVTGAGGTIGAELAWQLAQFAPAEVILLDHAEHDLYKIDLRMREAFPGVNVRKALCSIRERDALRRIFDKTRPDFVFHSAALKHVPMVEENPCDGVHTNIVGTRNVADAVCEFGVKAMVQISTDKAVNPVGIMGATKRVGEIYCQALDLCGVDDANAPRFITVRFGNVLGSSGSIVPLFKQQIEKGGPLTVTHPDITRYFMTVREAVQLVLQSSAQAVKRNTARGNIYVLDMGEPVKIYDLAAQMIRLAGYEPEVDIGIHVVGLRPGEKLYEELFDSGEEKVDSQIPGIFEACSRPIPLPLLTQAIRRLECLVREHDEAEIRRVLHNLVRIPSGKADTHAPFGDFASLMADYARGNFTVVSSQNTRRIAAAMAPASSTQASLRLVEALPPERSLVARWPRYEADEIEAVRGVLSSGRVNSLVHGEQTHVFEEQFARFVGAEHAIALANGTLALELALRALGVGPGDEVIVPARSFFATASCVVAVGAEPVFADVDLVSQNICPESVARMIGLRTKAVICVHLGGWPCDMEALRRLCAKHNIFLVEDCAQAHGAAIGGRRVGSFGHVAAFSFCTDKILSTGGEGGMLVTSDKDLWLRAWSYKDHGKSYEKVAAGGRGSAFRYVHDTFGSNLRLTEPQAAIGRIQLAKLPGWLERRQANAALLNARLGDHPLIVVPLPPEGVTHAWYKYNLNVELQGLREKNSVAEIVEALRSRGVTCGTGSCPNMSNEQAFAGRPARVDGKLHNATAVGASNMMLAIDHLFEPEDIVAIGELVKTEVA